MVERWGVEDLVCGEKRSLQLWSEKKRKKEEKNIYLLTCLRMRQWQRRDLRGLRGEAWWRGGGLRTRHGGKRGLCKGQKRNEKKKKKTLLDRECRQWRRRVWGLRKRGTAAWWFACPQTGL